MLLQTMNGEAVTSQVGGLHTQGYFCYLNIIRAPLCLVDKRSYALRYQEISRRFTHKDNGIFFISYLYLK